MNQKRNSFRVQIRKRAQHNHMLQIRKQFHLVKFEQKSLISYFLMQFNFGRISIHQAIQMIESEIHQYDWELIQQQLVEFQVFDMIGNHSPKLMFIFIKKLLNQCQQSKSLIKMVNPQLFNSLFDIICEQEEIDNFKVWIYLFEEFCSQTDQQIPQVSLKKNQFDLIMSKVTPQSYYHILKFMSFIFKYTSHESYQSFNCIKLIKQSQYYSQHVMQVIGYSQITLDHWQLVCRLWKCDQQSLKMIHKIAYRVNWLRYEHIRIWMRQFYDKFWPYDQERHYYKEIELLIKINVNILQNERHDNFIRIAIKKDIGLERMKKASMNRVISAQFQYLISNLLGLLDGEGKQVAKVSLNLLMHKGIQRKIKEKIIHVCQFHAVEEGRILDEYFEEYLLQYEE